MRAVFERDLVYEASRPRAFRSRTYLGLLVATAVAFVLIFCRLQLVSAPDLVATYVFRAGAATVVAMLALLTPASVAGAVLGERVQETLALVLASPVGPRRFALAKLLSRTAVILSWGLAALLPLGITVLLGGVGAAEVLRFVGVSTAVVLELAAWALWVSTVTRRPATAALLAAFWIVLMFHLAFLVQAGKLGPLAAAAAAMTTTAIGAAQGALGVRWGMLAPGRGPAVRGAAAIPLYSVAGYAGLILAPFLLILNERADERKQSRYLSAVGIPALLMGPPTFIVSTAVEVCETLGVRGLRSPGFFVFFLAAVWFAITLGVFIHTCSELPLLVRRELQKEEALPVPDREPPPLKVRLEKRRLALEERRKA